MLSAVATSVVVLLHMSCPSAIPRSVVPVVIDTVDGVSRSLSVYSRRSGSHIGEEFLERFPSRVNGDSTPSPVLEIGSFGVRTSVPHLSPRLIFGGHLSARAVSVTKLDMGTVSASDFNAIATTGVGSPFSQSESRNLFLSTAGTYATPFLRSGAALNGPTTERFSTEVNQSHAGSIPPFMHFTKDWR